MNSAEQTVTWLITLGVLESPKKTISDPEGFLQASLKDGVVLCRLLERLLPGTIAKVYPEPRSESECLSNIREFLRGCGASLRLELLFPPSQPPQHLVTTILLSASMMIIPHLLRDKDQRATAATSPRTRQCWGTENEAVQLWPSQSSGGDETHLPLSLWARLMPDASVDRGHAPGLPKLEKAARLRSEGQNSTVESCSVIQASSGVILAHCNVCLLGSEKWNPRIADLRKQIEELSERKYDMNL
ncbi:uncharacterized protein [Gorilla gorilla gorilla]|uniref:uncharacterized protein isoform X3 n=1 Tax=Gorilla gorilla gorilla TaxID=9595 RepID=UPI003009DDA9